MNRRRPLGVQRAVAMICIAVPLCASTAVHAQSSTAKPESAPSVDAPAARVTNPKDPFESINRKVFAFNDAIDTAVLAPVARAYVNVVPSPARTAIGNFLGNFNDAWSTINHFLQGKLQSGLEMMTRVGINTVFGLGGLLDIASEAGLERQDEDFGQTLGRWGVPPGPYLVLPLLGPSNVRDAAALPLDKGAIRPALAINDSGVTTGLSVVGVVDTRARLLNASKILDDVALDKYQFLRDAFLARRRSLVYDGDPPEEKDPEDDKPAKALTTPTDTIERTIVSANNTVEVPSPSLPVASPGGTKRGDGLWGQDRALTTVAPSWMSDLSRGIVDQVGGP